MSQRPVKHLTIRRRAAAPDNSPTGHTAANAGPSEPPPTPWIDPTAIDRPETPTPASAPTGGESLPDTSGGRICDRCGAYVVRPDIHGDWHRNLDRHIRLVQDVFQARGYVAKGGDIATDGEGGNA